MRKLTILSLVVTLASLSLMANAGDRQHEIQLANKKSVSHDKAPAEIILVSKERAGVTNSNGTGLYWDIIRAVYAPVGVRPRFIIRSRVGSVDLDSNKKADAVVGAYREDLEGVLFPNYPLAKENVLVVFKKEKLSQWEGIDSIQGKRVAWVKDFHFERYLGVPVNKQLFSAREHILKLLENDQIDFFVDTQYELESALNSKRLDITNLTAEILMDMDLYLAFANSKKGSKLRDIFNTRFPKLVESGELEKLLVKWNSKL